MDPITVITALVGLGNSLADFANKMNKEEFSRKVIEWNKELLQTQATISELLSKNTILEQENKELKSQRQQDIDNPLSISAEGYYLDTQNIPYCAGCYDGPVQRRVHLRFKVRLANNRYEQWDCPFCDHEYNVKK